jgi:two-component system cell cycle sensor histidine kinase/response regulator CckA
MTTLSRERPVIRLVEGMSPAEALNTQPANSQRVILVVDDESGIRDFLAAYLQSKNFRVFTADSAEGALNLWPDISEDVALLITDIVMPGLNGKRLSERLITEKPSLKVIYMSGFLPEEIAEETLDGTFFRKPFHPQELFKAVCAALH